MRESLEDLDGADNSTTVVDIGSARVRRRSGQCCDADHGGVVTRPGYHRLHTLRTQASRELGDSR